MQSYDRRTEMCFFSPRISLFVILFTNVNPAYPLFPLLPWIWYSYGNCRPLWMASGSHCRGLSGPFITHSLQTNHTSSTYSASLSVALLLPPSIPPLLSPYRSALVLSPRWRAHAPDSLAAVCPLSRSCLPNYPRELHCAGRRRRAAIRFEAHVSLS